MSRDKKPYNNKNVKSRPFFNRKLEVIDSDDSSDDLLLTSYSNMSDEELQDYFRKLIIRSRNKHISNNMIISDGETSTDSENDTILADDVEYISCSSSDDMETD